MGSVHYFSPEQAKGYPVTAASDLYSMGVVIYEMLTGRVPFDGDTPVSVAMQHVSELPKPVSMVVPSVCPALEQVLSKALCKNIPQRYATAEAMIDDLRRALRQPQGGFVKMRPAPAVPNTRPNPPVGGKRARRRNPLVSVFLVLLTLTLFAGVAGVISVAARDLWTHMRTYMTMPGVQGLDESVALDALRKAGLETIVLKQHDDIVLPGFIISQEPLEGVEVARGAQATLRISLGSSRVLIPDVVGMPQEEAETALTDSGLAVGDVLTELSDSPVGQVIRQLPVSGGEAQDGMTVDLHVSGGLVIIPDLTGLRLEDAELQLTQLGLVVSEVTYVDVDSARQEALVQGQSLQVADRVFPGAEVSLRVGRFDRRPFRKRVTLYVDIPKSGAQVRVTLIGPDGEETEQYAARHALRGTTALAVELRSAYGGDQRYRVYVDDLLVEENVISFE
jgi:serine/threonine-protein kinase